MFGVVNTVGKIVDCIDIFVAVGVITNESFDLNFRVCTVQFGTKALNIIIVAGLGLFSNLGPVRLR